MKQFMSARGFTLIEAMVVAAIVAILAAIAVPNYNEHIRQSSLQEAFSELANQRVKLEQAYQDNRTYESLNTAGSCASLVAPAPTHRFAYACALGAGGQGYSLTATGSVSPATGHQYILNESNTKMTTQFKGTAVNASCWWVKGTEC